jgi:RNA polymerase sigma-70 factor (ECF subfamily)
MSLFFKPIVYISERSFKTERGGAVDDRQIISLLINMPSEGMYTALQKYSGLVQMIIARILRGCPQDVEECVADTFVNAWKTIDRLDAADSSLKGYLICIARNTAINRYRQLKKQNAGSVVLLEDTISLSSGEDILHSIIQDEDTFALQQLIMAMDQPDRDIFIRKYFLFESVKEIAEHVAADEVQVKNRLYRGRQRLRAELLQRGVSYAATQ